MTQILLFILLGLGPGALIAAIALSVVLTYRGSGVINLATGGVAMIGGYAFWALRTDQLGCPDVDRPGARSSAWRRCWCSARRWSWSRSGRCATHRRWPSSCPHWGCCWSRRRRAAGVRHDACRPEPSILPQNLVHVLGAVIPADRFILTGIVIAMAVVLAALYRWSRFGLATRAASENQVAAMLGGLSPSPLSLANTLLASLIAGALGILAASITSSWTPSTLPLQIVPGAGRRADGRLHLVRDRLCGRDRHRASSNR